MGRIKLLAVIVAVMTVAGLALADDLTGANKFLCTAVHAVGCDVDGDCESGPPWNLNIPQFIEIDLEAKRLSTTKASGENRSTPIKNLERERKRLAPHKSKIPKILVLVQKELRILRVQLPKTPKKTRVVLFNITVNEVRE